MQQFSEQLQILGSNIRQKRKADGITQEGLAERADLHRTYIADIERGARNVSIVNIIRIAKALHMSVSDLCAGLR